MKRIILTICITLITLQPTFALDFGGIFDFNQASRDERAVKKVLKSQVKYANRANFNKFISTFDKNYVNADGFTLSMYSDLVKDIWETYDNITYGIAIKNVSITDNSAIAELLETSYADIPISERIPGELKSEANSVYYLKKINGNWKVVSDKVIDEKTTMLYGEARNLDIKLTAPKEIEANTDYTASLEFTPPAETVVVASIASDKVEYPQKPTKEVFRTFPEDNILERFFTSNDDNMNEYIVASIGLTKAAIEDLSVKLSLTGFGYAITRVNVIPQKETKTESIENDKNK